MPTAKEILQTKILAAIAELQVLESDLALLSSVPDGEAQAVITQAQLVVSVASKYL
jgi:hypothetical protein